MSGTKGLDALAALCGNVPAATLQVDDKEPSEQERKQISDLATAPTFALANGSPSFVPSACMASSAVVTQEKPESASLSFDASSLYAHQAKQSVTQQAINQTAPHQVSLFPLSPQALQAYWLGSTAHLHGKIHSVAPLSAPVMGPLGGDSLYALHHPYHHAQAQLLAAQILASSSSLNPVSPGFGMQTSVNNPGTGTVVPVVNTDHSSTGIMPLEGSADSSITLFNRLSGAEAICHEPKHIQTTLTSEPKSGNVSSNLSVKPPNKFDIRTSCNLNTEHPLPNACTNDLVISASSTDIKSIESSSSEGQGLITPNIVISEWEDKKQAKRAANRLSAHLSRKRKKIIFDELSAENNELRRKVQILRSIPDFVVVFDSRGCISFVSCSVSTLLNCSNTELEKTSFWDLLSEGSVKLIKSSFMDALAMKRNDDIDAIPLSNGESLLVEFNNRKTEGSEMAALKGVVHFTDDSPECVCTIRPVGIEYNIPWKKGCVVSSISSISDETPSKMNSRRQGRRDTVTVQQQMSSSSNNHVSDVESEIGMN